MVFGTNDKMEQNENKHFLSFQCTVLQLWVYQRMVMLTADPLIHLSDLEDARRWGHHYQKQHKLMLYCGIQKE